MSDGRLHLPPGYIADERPYGTVVMNTATGDLVLVATPSRNSNEEIGEAAWEHYSDAIRDYIMDRRVAVEFVAGERAVGEVDEVKTDLYEALEELLACAETFDEFHDPQHDWYPVLFGVRAALDKAKSIEDTLAFWHREGGLKVGSRYLVSGMNGLVDVLAIQERGEYLDVRVRDTETGRITVETIKREAT